MMNENELIDEKDRLSELDKELQFRKCLLDGMCSMLDLRKEMLGEMEKQLYEISRLERINRFINGIFIFLAGAACMHLIYWWVSYHV